MSRQRHAYLIAAHGGFDQLKALLRLLDVPENDVYLHMDKKAKAFRAEDFASVMTQAAIHFVPRLSAGWGSPCFIDVMLSLLSAATATEHQYYHLLSGADLPLKPQKEIRAFFDGHAGLEFLNYQAPSIDPCTLHYRLGLFHPLYALGLHGPSAQKAESLLEALQNRLHIDRLRHCSTPFQKGHLWFSVTHGFAAYAVAQAPAYRPLFRLSACGDEMFFHTIMLNSPFNGKRYMPDAYDDPAAALRCIDWSRGDGSSPYTYTLADYETLQKSPCLFARKFNASRDPELFERILEKAQTD